MPFGDFCLKLLYFCGTTSICFFTDLCRFDDDRRLLVLRTFLTFYLLLLRFLGVVARIVANNFRSLL